MEWYVGSTGNHQGLVIEEESGRNVAVAYDKKDAPLLAAAPELLKALQRLDDAVSQDILTDAPECDKAVRAVAAAQRRARAAISKAKGE